MTLKLLREPEKEITIQSRFWNIVKISWKHQMFCHFKDTNKTSSCAFFFFFIGKEMSEGDLRSKSKKKNITMITHAISEI